MEAMRAGIAAVPRAEILNGAAAAAHQRAAAPDALPVEKQEARDLTERAKGPLFLPVDDFFATCGQQVEYILAPYLPRDGFLLVHGAPKGGKTWFLGYLACAIAALGHVVMFIEEEGAKETLRERLRPFKKKGARIHVSHRKGWKLDDERSLNRLIEEIKAAGAHVLILDPLNQLHHHLRKGGEVPSEVILAIARIMREAGCAVILACHDRKTSSSWDKSSDQEAQSADIAGSYAWSATVDNMIQIKAVPPAERRPGEARFYVSNTDTRNGEPFLKRLAVVLPGAYRTDAMTFTEPESAALKALRRLWPHVPTQPSDATSVDGLREAAGIGKALGQSGVDLGLRTGVLVRRIKGGGIYRAEGVGLSGLRSDESDPDRTSDSSLKGSPESEARGAP